ncbi:hypothetical protein LCGC14_0332100 [marine sediment metagenome]|uniref:Uncharacterized protein n=1 Tax=marine sediment metagenome TaxID=412755 RepID=A0A0F9W3I1_9ZZZZ
MARQMKPHEIEHMIQCLRICKDDGAREALRLLEQAPKVDERAENFLKVRVVDDLSHDMWILKPCGFLVWEIDL